VLAEQEPVSVKNGLVKQEYIVGDATGSCKVVAWEENVGTLEVGYCYRLIGAMVRIFKGEKYLSVPKEDFKFEAIADIGHVQETAVRLSTDRKVCKVSILGVRFMDAYRGCYRCFGKVLPQSILLGQCSPEIGRMH